MTIDTIFTADFWTSMFGETDKGEPKATAVMLVIFGIGAFVCMFLSLGRFLLFLTWCVNILYLEVRKQSLSTKKE